MERIKHYSTQRLRNLHNRAIQDGFFNMSFWPELLNHYRAVLTWEMDLYLPDLQVVLRAPYLDALRRLRNKTVDVAAVPSAAGGLDFAFLVVGERWYALRKNIEDLEAWKLEGLWREALLMNLPIHWSGEFRDLWLAHPKVTWGFSFINSDLHVTIEGEYWRGGCFVGMFSNRSELVKTAHLRVGNHAGFAFAVIDEQCYPLERASAYEGKIKRQVQNS